MNERDVRDMNDQELVNGLREHAEWAEGNQWETPITLCDDLAEAADRLENQNTHIAVLQMEIEKLRSADSARRSRRRTARSTAGNKIVPVSATVNANTAAVHSRIVTSVKPYS